MKTHRNILIISFIIGIISLPFLIFLDKGKIYEIMLALLTSSIISFLLELPNYFSLKNDNKSKLYASLYSAKSHAYFLINNIENMKDNNISLFDKFYSQNVNNISIDLNILETYDKDYYFFKSKNEQISYLKRNLRSSWQNINLASLKFSISFAKLKMEKIQNNENEMIFIPEIENEINLILEVCKKFMKAIDDTTSLVFTKKQLENWISDNIVLENNELNSKVTKI